MLLRQLWHCFLGHSEILFSVLLGAVIICIVGENKENKVHEYVPVNWILSVQAELGTQASSLPACNNDGVLRGTISPLKQLINSRESLSPRVRSDKSSASPSVINMSLTTSSII